MSDDVVEWYKDGEEREEADEIIFTPPNSKSFKIKKILEKNKELDDEVILETKLNDVVELNGGGGGGGDSHVHVYNYKVERQYEGDYTISFISHSEKPQMLAVVSDIL